MQVQQITVGTSPVEVTFDLKPTEGVTLLARKVNTGSVYLGTAADVDSSSGVLVPRGDPGAVIPAVVSAEHFAQTPGTVFLVADAANQIVDVVSQ